ncbi:metal-dependent hydrolase [Gracilibacillus thailandensis]|uniref:Metal-dependent hydrolase n=1 Tax=Gracilibacillus thailandensis TaxID=563735 RepID=A0A6N7QZ73_9BACI|nr:metal-dependent hydrolase [Gracilibacillus thailandensis]MRI66175.1 metal-dependent hydrolase [Gracilibacillus thailandensis]
MEWTTHAVTGIGLGYAFTGDWKIALISGAMAVVPDLDEPRSRFGKLFFFISIPLNMLFGHRTFTHSLLFVALLGGIVSLFSPSIAIASIIGVLTHILGDMATGKVKLLYPLPKSIGISVSRFNYLLIDRLTRLATVVLICVAGYQEFQHFI